jgi:elongation factor Ts
MVNDIQRLREETGAGVMECKKAFQDAGSNYAKAVSLIRERGLLKAEKRAHRATGAGLLEAYVHNGRVGVLVDLRAETDFVANSEPFRNLAHDLTLQISAMNPGDAAELLKQPYIKDASQTVDQVVKGVIAQVGENIRVERFVRYEL